MEKEEVIIVYTRVSSAAQNLAMQVGLAKQYMERENIDLNKVTFIDDHDVSATKLGINDRKGLTEVIKLIKQNKVKKLIVYKRDRLARNFYEYTELAKLFIEYDIEVIFTASNEAPFMQSVVFESFHGMLGQMEGLNIRSRTDDARKQYPSNILGYKRTKIENSVRYTAHPEKASIITSLFEKASRITSSQLFIEFLIEKDKFKFDQKLKVLTNAFYAGYFQKNDLFQQLPYVEPLIDLNTFKKVTHIIEVYLNDFHEAVLNTPSLLYNLPTCAICKATMKLKQSHPLDAGSIYCSNGHKKVEILVIEYNQQISLTLHEELLKISHTQLKIIVLSALKREKKKLEQQLKKLQNDYQNALLNLTSSFDSIEIRYDKSLSNLDSLKSSISKTTEEITAIEQLILEIKSLTDYISSFKLDWNQEDLIHIAALLIEEINVGHDFTSISFFLTAKRNEGSSC